MFSWAAFLAFLSRLGNYVLSRVEKRQEEKELSDAQEDRNALDADPVGWFNKLHKRDKTD